MTSKFCIKSYSVKDTCLFEKLYTFDNFIRLKIRRHKVHLRTCDIFKSVITVMLQCCRSVPLRYADSDGSSSECGDDASRSAKVPKKSSLPPLPKAPLPPPFVETSQATLGNSPNDEAPSISKNIPSSVEPQVPFLPVRSSMITPSETQATPFLSASITPDVSHFPPRNNSISESQSTPVSTSYSTHRSTSIVNRSSRICSGLFLSLLWQI
jgi:hypothetical protein